jgi:hypothetical protein
MGVPTPGAADVRRQGADAGRPPGAAPGRRKDVGKGAALPSAAGFAKWRCVAGRDARRDAMGDCVGRHFQTGMTARQIPDTYTAMAWISNLAPP